METIPIWVFSASSSRQGGDRLVLKSKVRVCIGRTRSGHARVSFRRPRHVPPLIPTHARCRRGQFPKNCQYYFGPQAFRFVEYCESKGAVI